MIDKIECITELPGYRHTVPDAEGTPPCPGATLCGAEVTAADGVYAQPVAEKTLTSS